MFLLSEALDEQLKTLWFSPFQTDEIESDLEMVSVLFVQLYISAQGQGSDIQLHCVGLCDFSTLY